MLPGDSFCRVAQRLQLNGSTAADQLHNPATAGLPQWQVRLHSLAGHVLAVPAVAAIRAVAGPSPIPHGSSPEKMLWPISYAA